MSRFHVGQRVRIRFCYNAKLFGDFTGYEGQIIGPQRPCSRGTAWPVRLAGAATYRPDGVPHLFMDEQLDPILPEGQQPAELTVEELLPFLKARVLS